MFKHKSLYTGYKTNNNNNNRESDKGEEESFKIEYTYVYDV